MDVTPLVRKGQNIIQSYANGVFKVSGERYESAVIITPSEVIAWDIGQIRDVENLKAEHIDAITQASPDSDVFLLGSGAKMNFLSADLRRDLKKNNITLDVMDTGAACRTYNVLMAEGRRVVCALMVHRD